MGGGHRQGPAVREAAASRPQESPERSLRAGRTTRTTGRFSDVEMHVESRGSRRDDMARRTGPAMQVDAVQE
ncbi:hypothetical protein C9J85_11755 [Haloferax sp. wsp5]|nr:hypothetical protein C9J85_11755 [Haloferax sp. wsp5]